VGAAPARINKANQLAASFPIVTWAVSGDGRTGH